MAIEREIALPLLPGAEALGAEEDRDRAARGERPLQRLRPRLPGGEIPTVEKNPDAALVETARDPLHGRMVDRAVAEEDVEGALHGVPHLRVGSILLESPSKTTFKCSWTEREGAVAQQISDLCSTTFYLFVNRNDRVKSLRPGIGVAPLMIGDFGLRHESLEPTARRASASRPVVHRGGALLTDMSSRPIRTGEKEIGYDLSSAV